MPQTLNYGDFAVDFHVNTFPAGQHTQQPKPSSTMTNTLIVAGIARSFFQNPVMVSILERHFQLFGHVHSWVLLPSFGRIMVVYYDEADAERARQDFDTTALRHTHDWYALAGSSTPRPDTDLSQSQAREHQITKGVSCGSDRDREGSFGALPPTTKTRKELPHFPSRISPDWMGASP